MYTRTMRFFLSAMLLILFLANPAWAGQRFQYRFHEGDIWKMSDRSETSTEMMGNKMTQRTKRVTVYKIARNMGKGWFRIAAQVTAQKNWDNSGQANEMNSLEGMQFTAEVHKSGMLKNYKFSGGNPQIAKMIGPAMKPAIFFFPEFPEEALEPGDEFDALIRYEMPGMMGMGGMKSVIKMTYTLEDISDGLATFTIKQRMKMKGSGMDMKSGGKSEALFDLSQGMWVEHETVTKSTAEQGPGAGATTLSRSKVTLEKK
ncbi:MAG: hypothetical protein P8X96_12535 [Desulfobacteraceae bacterium]